MKRGGIPAHTPGMDICTQSSSIFPECCVPYVGARTLRQCSQVCSGWKDSLLTQRQLESWCKANYTRNWTQTRLCQLRRCVRLESFEGNLFPDAHKSMSAQSVHSICAVGSLCVTVNESGWMELWDPIDDSPAPISQLRVGGVMRQSGNHPFIAVPQTEPQLWCQRLGWRIKACLLSPRATRAARCGLHQEKVVWTGGALKSNSSKVCSWV